MSSRTLLLLGLCLVFLTKADVIPIEFYQTTPQYFPANTFDTITSSNLRTSASGSFKYSIATWFKISRTMTGSYAILLHLTALDGVEYPWDSSQYTSGVRHLANLIRLRYTPSNGYLLVDVGTFTNYQNQDYNYYTLGTNCWHYVYVGVNHETARMTYGVLSDGCQSLKRWNYFSTSGSTYSNEALDKRLTLYLGGSKNHITTLDPNTESWPGSLYRTMFLVGFYTEVEATARLLMGGERKNMYFFFLDNTVVQQKLPSYKDPNTYLTLGADLTVETTDPTFNGVDGVRFTDTATQKMFITLSTELQDFNFISFWVRIDDTTPTSALHNIMSIRTASGTEFLSVMLVKSTQRLTLRRGAAVISNDYYAALNTWHFVFLTFDYRFWDSSSNAAMVVSFIVNSTPVFTNQRLSDTLPLDILKPLSVFYFGKVNGASDSVADGAIRNLIGGTGTYYVQDTTPTATCILSVGLQTPFCLYCNPASSLYADPSGSCVSTCPVGTYQDTRSQTCVPCDPTCSSCSGAGPNKCSTCSKDTPIYFQGTCFSACPKGTLKNLAGGCDCDPSCSNCNYNTVNQIAECVGCAINTLFLLPDKSRCVPAVQCPTGTLANSVTLACSLPGLCPGGTVPDYANKICSAFCPTNSVKVSTPSVQCYSKCPSGYYSTTNTPGVAGETTVGCALCTAPCATCRNSATECLSCNAPYLFHEDIYKCGSTAMTCQAGFTLQVPGFFCKACRTSCTVCSPILALNTDGTCVDTCPLGTTKTAVGAAFECQASTNVDATIFNKTASVPIISIPRKQNLVLVADYASPATITSVAWSLDPPDATLISQFFNGVQTNGKTLVIPSANLKDGQLYKVTFEVKDNKPSSDLEFVQVQTSAAVAPGTFTVSPSTGTAFQTEFTFTIAGFSAAANLKYDIVSFFERSQTVNGKTLIERVDTISIGLGVQQGTYKFIYPISQVQKPLTIELCAYNDYEQTCLRQSITLNPSGDLPLQKVLVWSADASTLKTLDRMLDFVRSISLFYARGWGNQISTEYSRGALLIENLVVTKNLIACNKVAECSNQGQCIFSGSSFTCKCELGLGGYNCFYGVREFDTVSIRVRDILTNLFSVKLDITNVEKAILILDELTNVLDLVEYNSIFFFRDILTNILQVPGLKRQHFRPIFSVLGEVIGFVKRSLTSTWFKAVDRSLLLVSLTNLVDSAFGMIDGVRWPENYFIVDTNFLKVMVINDISGTFLGSSRTSDLTIEFGDFGYTFPQEVIKKLPSASIKLLGYTVNPYSDSQTNTQITSVMKVEVFDVNGPVAITGLTTPITIKIPKLAATPVFQSSSSPYNCQYKSSTVRSKINFLTTGCSFVSESTTHVTCACTHLTEFVGQLNVDSLTSVPSSAAIAEVNNAFIAQKLIAETAKRAYYTSTPTTTVAVVTSQVTFIRTFAFPNLGLYFAAAIAAMYFLVMLFNMGNVKKNALKKFLDQGQSILVLTYHPVFSMFIRAHTATSNTQLMRVTKFFCMLESYAGLTSLIFFLLDLQFSLTGGSKLVISSLVTLILGPWLCYLTEYIYGILKSANNNKRRSSLYHYSHLVMMAIWAAATIGLVGLIRSEYRTTWMGSFILTTALDVVIFDLVILIFAMMQKNNSKYLRLFRSRGYYVDTGAASIITPEDEAALIAKIKKALRADNLRDIDCQVSPVFGGVNKIAGDLEDLNASHVTDINNDELKDNKEQPNQNDDYVLPDLEVGGEEGDEEIPQLVQNIERESTRQPRKNLSLKSKAVPSRMPTTKSNKPKLKY